MEHNQEFFRVFDKSHWMPACAGMTVVVEADSKSPPSSRHRPGPSDFIFAASEGTRDFLHFEHFELIALFDVIEVFQ